MKIQFQQIVRMRNENQANMSPESSSDVNKDLTFKAKDKDKDQTLKATDQDKDQTYKDKDQDKDQTPKDKDKDQTFKAKDRTRTRSIIINTIKLEKIMSDRT